MATEWTSSGHIFTTGTFISLEQLSWGKKELSVKVIKIFTLQKEE